MSANDTGPLDPLDVVLAQARPDVTVLTPAIEDELARMTVSASGPLRARRLPTGRMAAVTVTAALALGGAGAAAATVDEWAWWMQPPSAGFSYVLPSGAECNFRFVGNIHGATPEASIAISEYLGSVDLRTVLDVDAEIENLRADSHAPVPDGAIAPAPYGTDEYPSPDLEYLTAVNQAVEAAIVGELVRQGFDVDRDAGLSWQAEHDCPDAAW